jgi:hypothetical protein
MAQCILKLFKWKATFTLTRQHVFYVVGCALIIAGLAFFIDERVMGSGKELMTTALFTNQKYNSWYMPLLRIVGPIFSFTTGASGGVFAPALSAGASVGATISGWMHLSAGDIVRDGRLSDRGHPYALYFGYTRAGNDRSPQRDLPSHDGGDDGQPGGDAYRPAFFL